MEFTKLSSCYLKIDPFSNVGSCWVSHENWIDPFQFDGGDNLYCFLRNDGIEKQDFLGLREIELEFNAFIPPIARTGAPDPNWFPEPVNSSYEFYGDARGFGGGSSRVKATAKLLSQKIGNVGYVLKTLHPSTSIRRLVGSTASDTKSTTVYGEITFKNIDGCTTEVTFNQIRAAYAFDPHLSPKIDFSVTWTLKVVRKDRVEITVKGKHDDFPNYEGLIDHKNVYQFSTSGLGPNLKNLNTFNAGFPTEFERVKVINADTR